jgi:predicted secreted protein
LAAINLPRKIVVWADRYETKVSYISTQDLAALYELIPELTSDLRDIDLVTDVTIDR